MRTCVELPALNFHSLIFLMKKDYSRAFFYTMGKNWNGNNSELSSEQILSEVLLLIELFFFSRKKWNNLEIDN